ncbi:hypothetical protein GW7_11730 [Heterocephalus glaber]|uniref:Uncharacterized protein n=1 Tax=Heterocephalus glaber TaxID=10181 RepID=G5C9I6_HETGA|nr:hypothetical protein GW7_11730 [Heterocephalus glaber]
MEEANEVDSKLHLGFPDMAWHTMGEWLSSQSSDHAGISSTNMLAVPVRTSVVGARLMSAEDECRFLNSEGEQCH